MKRLKISKFQIEIKGNELGWLIKLAKDQFHSKEFQKVLEKCPELCDMLRKLLIRMTYNFGASENEYILMLKKDVK